jgi:hypothetical protein
MVLARTADSHDTLCASLRWRERSNSRRTIPSTERMTSSTETTPRPPKPPRPTWKCPRGPETTQTPPMLRRDNQRAAKATNREHGMPVRRTRTPPIPPIPPRDHQETHTAPLPPRWLGVFSPLSYIFKNRRAGNKNVCVLWDFMSDRIMELLNRVVLGKPAFKSKVRVRSQRVSTTGPGGLI